MLTVYHLGLSQSERIVWLCEELEIPYELIRYDRDSVTRLAPAEYKALHPLGTAPVIRDGEVVLAESGAIIDYIIGKHGGGRFAITADRPNFADYLFWFHFANGSMMQSLIIGMVAKRLAKAEDDGMARMMNTRGDHAFDMVEQRLAIADYFAGNEFSAADIIMLFPLTTWRTFGPRDLSPYPKIRAYLQRIGGRPAYQRAMAKGDPGLTPVLT